MYDTTPQLRRHSLHRRCFWLLHWDSEPRLIRHKAQTYGDIAFNCICFSPSFLAQIHPLLCSTDLTCSRQSTQTGRVRQDGGVATTQMASLFAHWIKTSSLLCASLLSPPASYHHHQLASCLSLSHFLSVSLIILMNFSWVSPFSNASPHLHTRQHMQAQRRTPTVDLTHTPGIMWSDRGFYSNGHVLGHWVTRRAAIIS